MAQQFKRGDLVILKSGGELMTVEDVDGDDIYCVWSAGRKVERDKFHAATLKKPSNGLDSLGM